MNLHRTSGQPDWEQTAPSARSFVQRLAASTQGVVSPANVITLIGLGLVVWGLIALLNNDFWIGFSLLVIGRLFDILDGMVAEWTKTKSPLGEIIDAVADKVGTVLTIIVVLMMGITYWWVIVALVIPQAFISVVIFYKKQKGIAVHPTRAGKLSMAAAWMGIVGLFVSKPLNELLFLMVGTYILIGLSLVLGLYALWQYSTGRD